MIEVADVFRRFAADYLSAHGASMLPSHRRAIEDILNCRTAALGGQVWRCETCNTEVFSYHSCRNRSCPKCHTAQTQEWLEHRQAEMLPVPYFHITVTVPAELREVLRANQRDGYGVLMQATATAIIELARDPRYVGGTVAVLAVLHTWTQQLNLHPHVHCLVSGGGISADATAWHPARRKFLLPIKALAKLVRGKFHALLRRKCPDLAIPEAIWRRPWILHVTAWGNGEQAVPDYLARYVFRIALTNARIVALDDETVTIQYKNRNTGRARTCRLSGEEFMRRFLQHVLPRGFHKVRYFGLWHPAQRHNAARVRQMLQLHAPPKLDPLQDPSIPPPEPIDAEPVPPTEPMFCPHCHLGRLIFIRRLTRPQAMGP
ncbi:MAG TPA: IS91 family transposase [Acetobacteraceae bacterium]|nr:IS91 family transposase [Acetobacteraceae bacterium]